MRTIEPAPHWLIRYRTPLQAGVDVLSWGLALAFAVLVRFDFVVERLAQTRLLTAVLVAGGIQVLAGFATGLYLGRRRYGSFEEVAILAPATLLVTVTLFIVNNAYTPLRLIPMSATIGGGVAAFVFMGSTRYAWRLFLERRRRPSAEGTGRLLVFGAGDAGAQIVNALLSDPAAPYVPVALLDDDHAKRHLRIRGVPVVGNRLDLAHAVERYKADALLIALPEAGAPLIREVSGLAMDAGLAVRVLPSVSELLNGTVGVQDIRPVSDADLLGRHKVDTDVAAIAGYLRGKRVLVTGAGGSIGSELCRQLHRFAPSELVMLDRDESGIHAVQLSIHGRASLDQPDVALMDIRDEERLRELFEEKRPQVVFHAAALKHVTALERHPVEALKTNVFGTLHLLRLSAEFGVERFVNISTDKAADPANVLGYTKRIAERLTSYFGTHATGIFLSVRFGNVLGSRGSVLDVFHAQIAAGGPVTVSHPEATRYFMTVEEAVQLVVQAGAIGRGAEALVLDMGEPVRIVDIARRLAASAPQPVDIVFTDLRPGEKLHEELHGAGERDLRSAHPLISHVEVPALDPRDVEDAFRDVPPDKLVAALAGLAMQTATLDLRDIASEGR